MAGLLVYWFLRRGRGSQEPKRALVEAAGFGVLGFALGMVLEVLFVGPPSHVVRFASRGWQATELAAVTFFAVGVIEELSKLLPLTWFVYKRPYFNTPSDGVIYYGFAGMAFGLLENILYTLSKGAAVGVARLILMPYFHAALTGIAGYYIVCHKLQRISLGQVVVAISSIILLHGFYDFLLMSGNIGLVLLALPLLVLIVSSLFRYLRQAQRMDQEVAPTTLLS